MTELNMDLSRFVRELLQKKIIDVRYISTKERLADGFTKVLNLSLFRLTFGKTSTNPPHIE